MEGFSLDTQKKEIEDYCKHNNIALLQVYIDTGVSAYHNSLKDRPQGKFILDLFVSIPLYHTFFCPSNLGRGHEIQKILIERIEDKQNADMYDKMIDARRNDIEKFKKEVYEIENIDKTIKERKSTLKHSIELLDDIIAENNISKEKEPLLKKYMVVDNESLNI